MFNGNFTMLLILLIMVNNSHRIGETKRGNCQVKSERLQFRLFLSGPNKQIALYYILFTSHAKDSRPAKER